MHFEELAGEAAEIVDRLWVFHGGDLGAARLPVSRDTENGVGPGEGFGHFTEAGDEFVLGDGVHGVAVADEENGHPGSGWEGGELV